MILNVIKFLAILTLCDAGVTDAPPLIRKSDIWEKEKGTPTHHQLMTMKQVKQSLKTMRKSCQPKNNVPDEKADPINDGVFFEERDVMCYMACIMKMGNTIKNNKISYEMAVKQVDLIMPEDLKEPTKAIWTACRKIPDEHKDICEAAFHMTKCLYKANPDIFYFP